jgi:hypothetical protein
MTDDCDLKFDTTLRFGARISAFITFALSHRRAPRERG